MAELLFSHRGVVAFYACITVYLYGDLAIYAVGMFTTLGLVSYSESHGSCCVNLNRWWDCSRPKVSARDDLSSTFC